LSPRNVGAFSQPIGILGYFELMGPGNGFPIPFVPAIGWEAGTVCIFDTRGATHGHGVRALAVKDGFSSQND
jgi:hypothetical protein